MIFTIAQHDNIVMDGIIIITNEYNVITNVAWSLYIYTAAAPV